MHSFKLYPSNNKRMLNKDLTRFMKSLSFLSRSLRKPLLVGSDAQLTPRALLSSFQRQVQPNSAEQAELHRNSLYPKLENTPVSSDIHTPVISGVY